MNRVESHGLSGVHVLLWWQLGDPNDLIGRLVSLVRIPGGVPHTIKFLPTFHLHII